MSIINPNTLRACDITSAEGRELLKNYIDIFMNGGTKGFQGVDNKKARFQSAIFEVDDKTDREEIKDEGLKDMHFLFDTTHDMNDYFDRKDSFWYKSMRNIENHFNIDSECEYKAGWQCRSINKAGTLSYPQIIYGNFLDFKNNYVSNFNRIRKEIYKTYHPDILEDFGIEYRYDNGTIIPPVDVNMSNINFDEDKFFNKIKERWVKDGFVWNNDNPKNITNLLKSNKYGIIKDVCMKSTYNFLQKNGVTKEYVSYPQFLDSSPSVCNELSDTPISGITTKYEHSNIDALWIKTYNEMMVKILSETTCNISLNATPDGSEVENINFKIASSEGSTDVKIPMTEKRQNWELGRTPNLGFCSIEEVGILITAILQKRDLLEKSKKEFPQITFIENKNYNNLLDACIVTVPSETLFSDENLSTDIIPLTTDIGWFATYLNHQIMNTEYIVNERAILEKMTVTARRRLYEYLKTKYEMVLINSKIDDDEWYDIIIKSMEEMEIYGREKETFALNRLLNIKMEELERRQKDERPVKDVNIIIGNLKEQMLNINKRGGSRGDSANVDMGFRRSAPKLPKTGKTKKGKKGKVIYVDEPEYYRGKPKMLRELLDIMEKYEQKKDKVIVDEETTLEQIKEIITKKINLFNALRTIETVSESEELSLKDIILSSNKISGKASVQIYFKKSAIKDVDIDTVLDTVFKIESKTTHIPVTQLETFASSRYYLMQETLSVPVIRNKMISSNFLENDKFFSYELWNGIKDLITTKNYVDFIKIVLSFKALGDMSSALMALDKHSPTEPVVFVSYDRLCIAYILMMVSIMQKEYKDTSGVTGKNFKTGTPLIVVRTNLKGQITEYFTSSESEDYIKPSELTSITEENEIKIMVKTILKGYRLQTEGELKTEDEAKIEEYVDKFKYTYPVEAVWENDGEYYDAIITNVNESEGTYDVFFVDGDIVKVGYGYVKSLIDKKDIIIKQLLETANKFEIKTGGGDVLDDNTLSLDDINIDITKTDKEETNNEEPVEETVPVNDEEDMPIEDVVEEPETSEDGVEQEVEDDYFYSDLPSNMRDFPAIIYIADEYGNLYLDEMGEPIVVRNDKSLDQTDDMVKDTLDDTPISVETIELETLESPEQETDTFDKDDTFETLDKENIMKEQLDLMKEVMSVMSASPSSPATAAGGSI